MQPWWTGRSAAAVVCVWCGVVLFATWRPDVGTTGFLETKAGRRRLCYSHPSHANAGNPLDLSGRWVDTAENHVPYTFEPRVCARSTSNPHITPSRKAFAPHACAMEHFSPKAFVEVLHNRTLFVMGDSLTLHFAHSLTCLVSEPRASLRVTSWSDKTLPTVERFACRQITDTSATPHRTTRMCVVRMNQELAVALALLHKENELGPRDVVLANTGRHVDDKSTPELRELIHALPEAVRGDGDRSNPRPRVVRFRKMCEWLQGQYGGDGPTCLWRTTYAAKFATKSGDYEADIPAEQRQCASSVAGVESQRKTSLELAKLAGLPTINPFEASALVDKDEFFGKGDCSHFAQPSTFIFTAELLLMYLRQRHQRS